MTSWLVASIEINLVIMSKSSKDISKFAKILIMSLNLDFFNRLGLKDKIQKVGIQGRYLLVASHLQLLKVW